MRDNRYRTRLLIGMLLLLLLLRWQMTRRRHGRLYDCSVTSIIVITTVIVIVVIVMLRLLLLVNVFGFLGCFISNDPETMDKRRNVTFHLYERIAEFCRCCALESQFSPRVRHRYTGQRAIA